MLLMLEDFFLSKTVSTANVLQQLAALRSLGGTVLRLNPSPPPTNQAGKDYPGIGEQHRLAPFRVSLQVSIWNRQGLLALLRDGESPWAFEIRGPFVRRRNQADFTARSIVSSSTATLLNKVDGSGRLPAITGGRISAVISKPAKSWTRSPRLVRSS